MKIIIDLNHPCDINFFKHLILQLNDNVGIKLFITVLDRDPVPRIVADEFPNIDVKYFGKHRHTKMSIIFQANILKFIKLFIFVLQVKPDYGVSFGGYLLGASLKLLRKKNIQFDDDPEAKINHFLEKITATELIFPPIILPHGNISIINSIKEWAYLSPKYFTPNEDCLKEYNLIKKDYVFIREVNSNTTNYLGQKSNIIATITSEFPVNIKVVLSLEDKSNILNYPASWIVLKEPVKNIHSLMYFSKVVLSSGDSMAREGAVMGVPSIYCGIRNMAVNDILIKKGLLYHENIDNILKLIENIFNNEDDIKKQDNIRNELLMEWDDPTQFLLNKIKMNYVD